MACDPNFADVVLLAHFDTPSTFVDSSTFLQTITAEGDGAADSGNAKFGSSSLGYVTNGSNNGASVADSASLDFGGTVDWVIEAWLYYTAAASSVIQKFLFTSIYPYQILTDGAGSLTANGADGAGTTVYSLTSATGTLNTNAWNYIVLQRSGNVFSLYCNGTRVATQTVAGPLVSLGSNSYPVEIIGGSGNTGNIDEVRFTKGFARYSGATIPVPTEEFGVACPTTVAYPDLIGETYDDGNTEVQNAGFPALNPPIFQANATVAVGLIFLQNPSANSQQPLTTVGTVTVSTGAPSDDVVVPLIQKIGLSPQQANAALLAAGLVEGSIDVSTDPSGKPGTVFLQGVLAGTIVPRGTSIPYTVSSVLQPFDPSPTVISQYANSPTILQLVANMSDYLRPDVNFELFYNFVWNVDTAQGFGLDIWGKIVGISRLLKIDTDTPVLGFENADSPPDWSPFNQGTFYTGNLSSNTYILPDPAYRTLILTKALANIVATTAASLNRLLRNLFPNRGKCYVIDLGGMAMRFVFEFSLSPVEFAILTQSGALPHPAGVSFTVVVIQTGDNFGFAEQGGQAQPFDQGVFFA